jgi:quercetin dioxygenase-like cupin family protein
VDIPIKDKIETIATKVYGADGVTYLPEAEKKIEMFDAGVTFPVHSHDLDGELSIQVVDGSGFFLGENGAELPAKKGDILISQIREPHGVRAVERMRIVVTIAPPI